MEYRRPSPPRSARPATDRLLRRGLFSRVQPGWTYSGGRGLGSGGTSSPEIWLWNTADLTHPVGSLTVPEGYINSVAFSPNGHTLAADSDLGETWLWNINDPARPAALTKRPLAGPAGNSASVAFSADGRTLATCGDDGTVWLWNIADLAHPVEAGQPLATAPGISVHSVAFSPDGRTLAAQR